jgi:hypothetical protein
LKVALPKQTPASDTTAATIPAFNHAAFMLPLLVLGFLGFF